MLTVTDPLKKINRKIAYVVLSVVSTTYFGSMLTHLEN